MTLQELKKTIEHESDGDINCIWCGQYNYQGWLLVLENLEIRGWVETI